MNIGRAGLEGFQDDHVDEADDRGIVGGRLLLVLDHPFLHVEVFVFGKALHDTDKLLILGGIGAFCGGRNLLPGGDNDIDGAEDSVNGIEKVEVGRIGDGDRRNIPILGDRHDSVTSRHFGGNRLDGLLGNLVVGKVEGLHPIDGSNHHHQLFFGNAVELFQGVDGRHVVGRRLGASLFHLLVSDVQLGMEQIDDDVVEFRHGKRPLMIDGIRTSRMPD